MLGQPHWVLPDYGDDYRKHMNFVTVPSLESGEQVEVTKEVDIPGIIEDLRQRLAEREAKKAAKETSKEEDRTTSKVRTVLPEAGDVYDIFLTGECHVDWWNWGDIRDDHDQG